MKKQHLSIRGFTLIELLIVIAIILVLAGVLAPVGRGLITRSQAVNCSKNLRQIGIASMMYAGENNMTLPQSTHQGIAKSWRKSLQPYASGTITFKCQDDPYEKRTFTYVLNDFLTQKPSGAPPDLNYSILAKIDSPAETLMFAEASTSYLNTDHFHFAEYYGQKMPSFAFESQVGVKFHGDKSNYLFADGHVETLSWREVQALLRKDGGRFLNPSGK
ncbi:MAG: prepilin-type N-terminal cleavage/methylation domain-containing protein [Luteolibacter sp.]|uniref:prepilin-type N-terminal cleavage/methylation domain-containing protein n=1 Tax=Luteolibacter sp. TaxID=1962973 RepID=UPI0032675BF4